MLFYYNIPLYLSKLTQFVENNVQKHKKFQHYCSKFIKKEKIKKLSSIFNPDFFHFNNSFEQKRK